VRNNRVLFCVSALQQQQQPVYGVLQCCRRAALSVSVPHRTCLTVYALPGVVLLYQVTWEFWTNSNDECGPLCDKQKKFVRVRLLLKTPLSNVLHVVHLPCCHDSFVAWRVPPPLAGSC
jgi:hypothetical protein